MVFATRITWMFWQFSNHEKAKKYFCPIVTWDKSIHFCDTTQIDAFEKDIRSLRVPSYAPRWITGGSRQPLLRNTTLAHLPDALFPANAPPRQSPFKAALRSPFAGYPDAPIPPSGVLCGLTFAGYYSSSQVFLSTPIIGAKEWICQ